jgi:hypothetical protein
MDHTDAQAEGFQASLLMQDQVEQGSQREAHLLRYQRIVLAKLGFDWNVNSWAATADWRVPIASGRDLRQFYQAALSAAWVGIGQSILYAETH